ncbi:hypothetical protein OKW34_004091 [Paraburkholderia youngii]
MSMAGKRGRSVTYALMVASMETKILAGVTPHCDMAVRLL